MERKRLLEATNLRGHVYESLGIAVKMSLVANLPPRRLNPKPVGLLLVGEKQAVKCSVCTAQLD